MTDESSYGREPVTIVELYQPRCGLRFGVAPCTATGTPKCYNTWGTCLDQPNIDLTGSITWRFRRPDAGILPMYEESGDDIKTNPLAMLESVSTSSAELNLGGMRDGKSALGIRAGVTVQLRDALFDDHVGDYYLADRSATPSTFWRKWRARNLFFSGMRLSVYEGYRGQAIGDMQRRDYILDAVDGPTGDGRVTLRGRDPLALTEKSLFPRASDLTLRDAIDTTSTTIILIGPETDLSANFGNTGSTRYVGLGSEAIRYTGWSSVGTNVWQLTGVTRATLGSAAGSHSANAAAQRIGRYENISGWAAAADLIDNHTEIDAAYRDTSQWTTEGGAYLALQRCERTVVEPTKVDALLGQLSQQCQFAIWWDERQRKIPLLANRPPSVAPISLTDTLNILSGTPGVTMDPEAQITRVLVRYAPRDPFKLRDAGNYRFARLTIEAGIEAPEAANTVRELVIDAPWLIRDYDANALCAAMLLRYRYAPQFLSLEVDAKDRSIKVGDVADITTNAVVDSEGNALVSRWQAVRAEETVAGHKTFLRFQSYYFTGRFGFIMPNTANDYASATADEKATGCYIADSVTLLMPDGSDPYLMQ